MTNPQNWQEEYKIEFAKILGREGKFAMNSFVALAETLLKSERERLVERIRAKIAEMENTDEDVWTGSEVKREILNLIKEE